MGTYKPPLPVKLVIGLLSGEPGMLESMRARLADRFGPEEEVLPPIPFTWTRYYLDELGPEPWRSFVSYERLIQREEVVAIKRWTNELEAETSVEGKRRVNLDPGYMTLGQFFLATTKDQRHRVYVRDGIFIEPTLYFENGLFQPFAWTYPDYRSEVYLGYLRDARAKLAYQMHHGGKPYSGRKAHTEDAGIEKAERKRVEKGFLPDPGPGRNASGGRDA
jgi:hypothetical protein